MEETEIKEGVVYFENASDNLIRYKVKNGDEIHSDEIHLSQLKDLPDKAKAKLESGDLSVLNTVKNNILDITSKRGHTKKELTFWGKIQILFKAIKQGIKDVLGERHDASKLETFGNLFYNTYQTVGAELQEYTEHAEMLHKVISTCEHKISHDQRAQKQASLKEHMSSIRKDIEPAPSKSVAASSGG